MPPSVSLLDGSYNALVRRVVEESSSEGQAPKWSSAIGIVTAICGNTLISFALNTQRYAHMRISREREEREEKQRQERKRQRRSMSYGTQQSQIAEDRAKTTAESEPGHHAFQDPHASNETEPLIPSVDSLDSRRFSSASEDLHEQDEDGNVKEKSYLKSPIWWAGITMMTLGETGNFLAYGFAPASIVSPLGVVALISNCLIAPWLLRERFRWRDGIGVIIAVAGCVTVVLSASSSNPKLDPDSIWHLISTWEFETYFGITSVLILALCIASNRIGEKSILIDLGLMGLFGGYTALSTKGVASLLSSSIWRVVTFPITYLLTAVLVFTAVMQIKYVNRALQRFDSTQVIPTQFVLFTLSVIVGSAILYRDFERTTTQQAIKFVGGCALTFSGVWCITSGRHDDSQGDEETGEDEDAINLVDEEGVQPEIREREDDVIKRQSFIAGSSKGASGAQSPRIGLEDTRLENEPVDIPPGTAAAIHSHSDSTSSIPHGAVEAVRRASKPPPMHATTSEPIVPRIDASSPPTPKTPLERGHSVIESSSKDAAATPIPRSSHNLEPNESHRLLNRRSVVGLLPGPLSTPLSSSLSAIVADSLRRGVDSLPTTSARRRSMRLKRKLHDGDRTPTADATPSKRHSIASGELNFDVEDDPNQSRPGLGSPIPGRMRSLSATLGDIFGSQKRRRMGSRDDGNGQQRGQEGGGGDNTTS